MIFTFGGANRINDALNDAMAILYPKPDYIIVCGNDVLPYEYKSKINAELVAAVLNKTTLPELKAAGINNGGYLYEVVEKPKE